MVFVLVKVFRPNPALSQTRYYLESVYCTPHAQNSITKGTPHTPHTRHTLLARSARLTRTICDCPGTMSTYVWILMSVACVALHAAKALERRKPPKLRRLDSDTSFSGDSVGRGKWWVFATATFAHGSWYHLTNNLIHLAGYAPQLEAVVGSLPFALLFLLTGAAGWALNLVQSKWKYGEMYVCVYCAWCVV